MRDLMKAILRTVVLAVALLAFLLIAPQVAAGALVLAAVTAPLWIYAVRRWGR